MDINNLNTRNNHIDTRLKHDKYGSNTNFQINLPQTVECPENCVMYVHEIVLPNTITTIQSKVNDKLYFAVFYNGVVSYKNITIPEQNYTLLSFANQLETLMNAQLSLSKCEFNIIYNLDKLSISLNLIDKRAIKLDVMRRIIFTDEGVYNFTIISKPLTYNEILHNLF